MEDMLTASAEFIRNYVPDGSYVGIIDFDNGYTVKSDMMLVETPADREALIKRLPEERDASGGTCLSCGTLGACNVSLMVALVITF